MDAPVCATCHARMDPLGFALENFDAIGKWRTHEAETPIDASGSLPDGTTFDGPAELRDVLVARHDEFVMTVTEKLLTYALGRGVEYYDRPVIRAILREAEPDDYRWSSIVLGIVNAAQEAMERTLSKGSTQQTKPLTSGTQLTETPGANQKTQWGGLLLRDGPSLRDLVLQIPLADSQGRLYTTGEKWQMGQVLRTMRLKKLSLEMLQEQHKKDQKRR